ncbi:hypothetical protein P1J78_14045 [Psychromarinibacter sp. C21-152]|uniref:FeoB-associated Cys-rich membrane protein n=1 Tax=Psychromarinibacter sediminicola TaxID=3033385 RepID=A0AAE3NPM9_9RHOB|nr:hypothetical protein [Psychromarinibacter sediminicola]MDF0601863.1 hypothetical protein [Psychromarinibacter sediminicola]
MELLLAIVITALAAGGLALGLALRGKPPQTACEGTACAGGERCAGCPNREKDAAHG